MDSSPAAGNVPTESKSPASPSHIAKQSSGSCKVRRNHPWMAIVHPGPWMQLPPTTPPVTPPGTWYRPRVTPPNPFGEVKYEATKDDVVDGAKTETNPSTPSKETSQSVNDARIPNESIDTHSLMNVTESNIKPNLVGGGSVVCVPDLTGAANGPEVHEPGGATPTLGVPETAKELILTDVLAFSKTDGSPGASGLAAETLDHDLAKAANSTLTITGTPASIFGFPLIKRKVQTDPYVASKDLDAERKELEMQLEVLEQRGVEVEIKLRCCDDEKEEEKMLMDWLIIVHKKHVLTRQDAELVYLIKQRDLEERQADVEYQLRCLLNKSKKEWSQEDRVQEQQLMNKMVTVIEQRNEIISSLDQDRQREKEEDNMLEVIMNSKDLQKEGWEELKKTKGKSKPMEVFKVLFNKSKFTKNLVDKKS